MTGTRCAQRPIRRILSAPTSRGLHAPNNFVSHCCVALSAGMAHSTGSRQFRGSGGGNDARALAAAERIRHRVGAGHAGVEVLVQADEGCSLVRRVDRARGGLTVCFLRHRARRQRSRGGRHRKEEEHEQGGARCRDARIERATAHARINRPMHATAAKVQLFGQERTRLYALMINATHDAEHYGNLVTYLTDERNGAAIEQAAVIRSRAQCGFRARPSLSQMISPPPVASACSPGRIRGCPRPRDSRSRSRV